MTTGLDQLNELFKKTRESHNEAERLRAEAAEASRKAVEAERSGDLDLAWKQWHDTKLLLVQRGQILEWPSEDIALVDSSIHLKLANILRKEKNHNLALAHIIYWANGGRRRQLKMYTDKLRTYFNRCKFKSTPLDEALHCSNSDLI